jgi:type IV pilus assembly protein PilO
MAQSGATVTYSEGGLLDRFPWYVQLLVLLAIILLLVFVTDYFMFAKWRDEASKKDQQAQELRRQNQEADIVRANIVEYQKRLDDLNAQFDTLKVRLPEEREVSPIFDNAKAMMSSSGLKLVKFQTNPKDKEVPQKYYTEVSSQVQVAGNYGNVQSFFQKLAGFDRIVNVTEIALSKASDADQAAGASVVASFNLTAFYISDANRQALESGQPAPEIDPKTGKPVPPKPGAAGAPAAKPAAGH